MITDRQLALISNKMGDNVPVPAPPRKMSNEESRIQQDVIKWWAANYRTFPIPEFVLFSIPNGGARSAVTGAIMKREGARKGVPDLFLAVPMGRYHGLFIEMKKPGGKPSPEQRAFLNCANVHGYLAIVAESAEVAQCAIYNYLT